MRISKVKKGNSIVIALDGRLDTTTAPEAEKVIKGEIAAVDELIFDLKELDYISSSGLRVMLGTQKTMNKKGTMIIKNVNDMVMEVFDLTGLSDVFTFG